MIIHLFALAEFDNLLRDFANAEKLWTFHGFMANLHDKTGKWFEVIDTDGLIKGFETWFNTEEELIEFKLRWL